MTVHVPKAICATCGEFLPHACAAEVTVKIGQWGHRRVIIRDRDHQAAEEAEAS